MPLIDPIELLKREDKWYLGNAGMLVYAPPFPDHADQPGFWDDCHFGDLALPRLMCLGFAIGIKDDGPDERLVEAVPVLDSWEWYPDRIEATYHLGEPLGVRAKVRDSAGIVLRETRSIGPDGTLHSELSFVVPKGCRIDSLHVAAWTARPTGKAAGSGKAEGFTTVKDYGSSISYTQHAVRRAHNRGDNAVALSVTMFGDRKPDSVQVTPSHSATLTPRLTHTPLWYSLVNGKLNGVTGADNALGSLTYAGLHWRIKAVPGETAPLRVMVSVRDPRAGSRPVPGRPHSQSGATPDPGKAWREFLSLVPHFESSDPLLTRYYWYRWYGLRLNAVPAGGNHSAPAVTEGLSYFRGVITYSLMCHLFECKWLSDPSLAQGCLKNHITHQTKAGHFPGHVYFSHVNQKGFYHTDVGRSVGDLMAHHPDRGFASEVYPALKKLLQYYQRERDREGLDLYDIWDQYETGQELSSRYFHADKRADLYGWEHKLRLKGVDVTTYAYHLAVQLGNMAAEMGNTADIRMLAELRERIKAAVRTVLWDDKQAFFTDYNVKTKKRSPYLPATGFYPALSDLATDDQALATAWHLDDHEGFAAPWPTPTIRLDDEYFQADPRWRGERANCPWNGRTWPMVNSHIVEVLANLARINPKLYRPKLAAYLSRFIELMHFDKPGGAGKDLNRPNCFEHYNPLNGTACEYRGVDDYMHSWVADLILKYVAGVRLTGNRLVVDPFPFGLTDYLLTNCRVAGHRLEVCHNRDRRGRTTEGYRVFLDGRQVFKADKPCTWECEL